MSKLTANELILRGLHYLIKSDLNKRYVYEKPSNVEGMGLLRAIEENIHVLKQERDPDET